MKKHKPSTLGALLLASTFALAEEAQLQEIIITTASQTPQALSTVTADGNVITATEIEDRGYRSVLQALNAMSGISFTSNGGIGTSSSVYLRGMNSQRTLVLIDGIRYNDPTSLSGAPFEHLLIDDIQQIEIIKGAQSGVWGADASAGVINIISKKAKSGTHGAMHLELGSFNTKKYGLKLSTKEEKYHFSLSRNSVSTDGFSAQAPEIDKLDSYEDDGYDNKRTSIKAGYALSATNKIDITHTNIDATSQYDPFGDPNGKVHTNSNHAFSSVNFNHVDSFNEVNVYAKRSTFARKTASTPFEGSTQIYGASSKIPYRDENFLLWGAEYTKFKQDDSFKKSFTSKSFFLNHSSIFNDPLGGKTIVSKALRYDKYSNFENQYTGKIGIKHQLGLVKDLSIAANYGTAFNIPTLYQQYSLYGNPDLSPEETKSFDVNMAYKNLSLSYFNTKIDDLIDFNMATFKYANISGLSKISGLELSYEQSFAEDFYLTASYTHLLKAQDAKGADLKRRPTNTAHLSLDYYGIQDFHVGVEGAYIGSREDIKFNPNFTTSSVQTGKYLLVNLSADYSLSESIKFYAKVENLTDKKYQSVYGYGTSPRAFYLGVKNQF